MQFFFILMNVSWVIATIHKINYYIIQNEKNERERKSKGRGGSGGERELATS